MTRPAQNATDAGKDVPDVKSMEIEDFDKRVTKNHPREAAGFDQMPWCFGKHSRQDKTCLEDCCVSESCFILKEG